jgi:hypothetical protein
MLRSGLRLQLYIAAAALLLASTASAAPLIIPFDFAQSELGLEVTVKGQALFMLLDTGVDPSVIDMKRTRDLGLVVDLKSGGEGDGFGDRASALAHPTTIDGLALNGRSFGPVEALTGDLEELSAHYGRRLDGILGFSFLRDKIVLVDYRAHRLMILDQPSDAAAQVGACRRHWLEKMRLLEGQNWPLISDFRLGETTLPATLDTGSSGSIDIYEGALALPGVKAALTETGQGSSTGFRGPSKLTSYKFSGSVGVGPFRLPAGQAVTLRHVPGSPDASLANLGNKLFAQLGLKMLLDYPSRKITFFGECG